MSVKNAVGRTDTKDLHAELIRGAENFVKKAQRIVAALTERDEFPRPAAQFNLYQERKQFHSHRRHFFSRCKAHSEKVSDALVEWAELEDQILHSLEIKPGPLEIRDKIIYANGKEVSLGMTTDRGADAITFLQVLIAARGNWVSSADIDEHQASKAMGTPEVRWYRIYGDLPSEIKKHIESRKRKGYRIIMV